jgi:hypothetical protein
MLDHELEHLSAGDPKLLLFAGVMLVLFPWNAALWLMTRRLRLAIEIDCDSRVVRGSDAADEYGLFLVAVGERRAHGLFLAASLAERRSSLERRIYAMTSLRPRYPILASLPFAALALGATVLAAQTPTPPAGAGGVIVRAIGPTPADRILLTNDDMKKLLSSHHAGIVNGTSDDNMLTVVLASNGEIVASGSGQVAVAATRATGGAAGGEVRVVARAAAPTAATAGGEMKERRVRSEGGSAEAGPSSNMMKLPGIGEIDRSLIKDQYMKAYDEGEVSPGRLMVRVVTLTGTAGTLTKK